MESLPNEVLIEIFDYLKFFDLKNLLGTCKRLNSIISKTSVLMDKFKFVIDENTNIDGIRKYRKIKIYYVHKHPDIFQEKFNNLWANIVDLTVIQTIDWSHISSLIRLTSNLKNLRFYYDGGSHDNEFKLKTFPKLELDSLTINFCYDEMALELERECSVKKLKIHFHLFNGSKAEIIKKILKRHTKLEHLILLDLNLDEFANAFDEEIINADLMLKTLELDLIEFKQPNLDNLNKFLQHQSSIRKIVIDKWFVLGTTDNTNELLNILSELTQIKELRLKNIELHFNPMHFIETLTLCHYYSSSFRNFRVIFPNVKDLTINYYDKLNFVEQLTEPEQANCNEMIITNVKSLAFKKVDFGNENPFDYEDIKVENLKLERCKNIDWLFEYLQTDDAKLNYLELEDVRITQNQHRFLESLTRGSDKKINELKIYLSMMQSTNRDYVRNYASDEATN